jgi:hypothetical protein
MQKKMLRSQIFFWAFLLLLFGCLFLSQVVMLFSVKIRGNEEVTTNLLMDNFGCKEEIRRKKTGNNLIQKVYGTCNR